MTIDSRNGGRPALIETIYSQSPELPTFIAEHGFDRAGAEAVVIPSYLKQQSVSDRKFEAAGRYRDSEFSAQNALISQGFEPLLVKQLSHFVKVIFES